MEKSSSSKASISNERTDSPAIYLPRPVGLINDFVHLLSIHQIKTLDSLVSAFERATAVEIGIAIVDTTMVNEKDFDNYTLVMARTWGIGKKHKNNGILVVISPDLRRMRIQNGYGIEKILSDSETKIIIDSSFTPRFKEGKYFAGIRDGIFAIINKLKQKGL